MAAASAAASASTHVKLGTLTTGQLRPLGRYLLPGKILGWSAGNTNNSSASSVEDVHEIIQDWMEARGLPAEALMHLVYVRDMGISGKLVLWAYLVATGDRPAWEANGVDLFMHEKYETRLFKLTDLLREEDGWTFTGPDESAFKFTPFSGCAWNSRTWTKDGHYIRIFTTPYNMRTLLKNSDVDAYSIYVENRKTWLTPHAETCIKKNKLMVFNVVYIDCHDLLYTFMMRCSEFVDTGFALPERIVYSYDASDTKQCATFTRLAEQLNYETRTLHIQGRPKSSVHRLQAKRNSPTYKGRAALTLLPSARMTARSVKKKRRKVDE